MNKSVYVQKAPAANHFVSEDVCISIFSTDKSGLMSVTRRIASASACMVKTRETELLTQPLRLSPIKDDTVTEN